MTYLEYEEYLKEQRAHEAQDLIDNPPVRKWLSIFPLYDEYTYIGIMTWESSADPCNANGFVVEYTPLNEELFKQAITEIEASGYTYVPRCESYYSECVGAVVIEGYIDGGRMKEDDVACGMIDLLEELLAPPVPEPSSLLDLFPDL